MQNNESSKLIATVSFSSKPREGDDVHYVETNPFRKNEAAGGAPVNASDTELELLPKNEAEGGAQMDEADTESALLPTNEAEVQVDASGIKSLSSTTNKAEKEKAQMDASDPELDLLLKDSTTRQNSGEIRITEPPWDRAGECPYIFDGVPKMALTTNKGSESVQMLGKFLPNPTSLHRDPKFSFRGLLILKY
jgi:hypothetical protein